MEGIPMSKITCNRLTNEIELIGSEAFIESNFYRIQNLIMESLGLTNEPS